MPTKKRDLSKVVEYLSDALRSVRAAQRELRFKACEETANDLRHTVALLEVMTKPQGILWYIENGQDWPVGEDK